MDAMDIMALHEQYNPPVIGAGNLVLFRRRNRNTWDLGAVYPPQRIGWKPGEPIGKRINIAIIGNVVNKQIEEDVVHINDPLYIHDPHKVRSCWELITNIDSSQLLGVYNELLSQVSQLQASVDAIRQTSDMAMSEVSKLAAANSMKQGKKTQPTLVPSDAA